MTGINDDKTLSRMTPPDDTYPTCERTCAKLLVYPGEMHPSRVTELLGLIPTRQIVAGEASSPNSLGLRRVGKINGWLAGAQR